MRIIFRTIQLYVAVVFPKSADSGRSRLIFLESKLPFCENNKYCASDRIAQGPACCAPFSTRCKDGEACLAKHRHATSSTKKKPGRYHKVKPVKIPAATFLTKEEYGPEPTNLEEEKKSPFARQWKEARLREMKSHEEEHKTWKLVPRPKNARVFKPKCVWKLKWLTDPPPHGRLDKFKFRVTIAAYTRMLRGHRLRGQVRLHCSTGRAASYPGHRGKV